MVRYVASLGGHKEYIHNSSGKSLCKRSLGRPRRQVARPGDEKQG